MAVPNRLRWRCRRGLLELDLILQGFLESGWEDLSADQRAVFARLLEESDQELQGWLLGRTQPLDPDLKAMVARIRARP